MLEKIRAPLAEASESTPKWMTDSFAWKAVLVEAVIWSMMGYALAAFLSYSSFKADIHVRPWSLVAPGLAVAVGSGIALIAGIAYFLERSSRSHRILVESGILLALSLPVFGIQAVADLNLSMDRSPSEVIEARVLEHWTQLHRGRRGRTWTSYHVRVERPEGSPFPEKIDVTSSVYQSLTGGQQPVRFELGRGRLGFPWYRRINGLEP